MELVTGFAGQAHVDPIDMAHVNAVAFGHDAYLLDTQNKLEPTLETANKLVVDTGDLMIQGHHFTVVQSEEIALQSGISGQKRNALVCARYDKASGTGIETASWVVKYGTATTGTPTDPDVTTGNILDGVDSVHEEPIFRIEYDGITPGDPILLVPEFQSNAKFRTSIAQAKYGVVTSGPVPSKGSTATQITFDSQFSEPPCVFIQDRSGGGNPSDMINNKTIVSGVTSDGFTARSFNNTSTTFPTGMTFYWMAIGK